MKTVTVHLDERSYNVYIGKGISGKVPMLLGFCAPDTPIFVVTNQKINRLYGAKIKRILKKKSKNVLLSLVPDSEKAKSFPVYVKTIKKLAHFARKTKPLVIAFGGGVVGDLAGFVASAYRRGVPYVNIPTTLLSQVDSAIGGKVAIDIKEAKNIVGDFYQPKAVFCDPQFLLTLPEKEVRNGLAEVIKYGIIKDRTFFSFLEKNLNKILKLDRMALDHIVFKCCSIKAGVVEKDEFDTKDVRAILNFGHTIGHAIEAASSYTKSIAHGEAVAFGMIMASYIALKRKMLKKKDFEKIYLLIKKTALKKSLKHLRKKSILRALSYDKKFIYGVNRFILPERIGSVKIVDKIPQKLIEEAIEANI